MSARKGPVLNWILALLFSLFSIVPILIILLSGVGGHVVAEYLTVDTTDLNVPSKLSSSTFLRDLSTLAGEDWVGSSASPESLGLSKTYSLTLLTACAQDDGSTTCGTPKIGFSFDPESDLKLDSTSIQGTLSSAYYGPLQTYSRVSTFLGVAYVLAALLTGFSCVSIIVSRCLPRAVIASLFSLVTASILLLTAAITSAVTFAKLRDALNNELGSSGLKTQYGSRMVGLSFGAAGLAFAGFLATLAQARQGRDRKYQGGLQDLDGKKNALGTASGAQIAIPMLTFANRIPGWNRNKYTQIEKQMAASHAHNAPYDSDDRESLIASGEDELSHGHINKPGIGSEGHNGYLGAPDRYHIETAYKPHVMAT
ncbi:hypothetical protein F4779DRAFT_613934 [Xylariaceae sp. FL0662B]|nr:hypothetical protein F4779DRAFT_613934 [Xylariaceae sp. FL0662B]